LERIWWFGKRKSPFEKGGFRGIFEKSFLPCNAKIKEEKVKKFPFLKGGG
jgi:hypothetical protein